MADLLMILNPRNIEECIESYKKLTIDRAWITGMDEIEAAESVYSLVARTGYDRYIVVSDDCVVGQDALDAVVALLDEGHPVVTGYCNLDAEDTRVNITKTPISGDPLEPESYKFWERVEVEAWPNEEVPTFFCGMALTGMTRDLWLKYPPMVDPLDYDLTVRLLAAGVPLIAAKGGCVWHVKEQWGRLDRENRKRLLIGEIPATVTIEECVGQARQSART